MTRSSSVQLICLSIFIHLCKSQISNSPNPINTEIESSHTPADDEHVHSNWLWWKKEKKIAQTEPEEIVRQYQWAGQSQEKHYMQYKPSRTSQEETQHKDNAAASVTDENPAIGIQDRDRKVDFIADLDTNTQKFASANPSPEDAKDHGFGENKLMVTHKSSEYFNSTPEAIQRRATEPLHDGPIHHFTLETSPKTEGGYDPLIPSLDGKTNDQGTRSSKIVSSSEQFDTYFTAAPLSSDGPYSTTQSDQMDDVALVETSGEYVRQEDGTGDVTGGSREQNSQHEHKQRKTTVKITDSLLDENSVERVKIPDKIVDKQTVGDDSEGKAKRFGNQYATEPIEEFAIAHEEAPNKTVNEVRNDTGLYSTDITSNNPIAVKIRPSTNVGLEPSQKGISNTETFSDKLNKLKKAWNARKPNYKINKTPEYEEEKPKVIRPLRTLLKGVRNKLTNKFS